MSLPMISGSPTHRSKDTALDRSAPMDRAITTAAPGLTGAAAHGRWNADMLGLVIGTIAGAGLAFQVGHFAEHATQFGVWVLGDLSHICGRDTPWMSPWATKLVRMVGLFLFPQADEARRMMLGMEVLHLIGNTIFLTSLACLYHCLPSKWVRWALYIEGFHFCEHIALTATAYYVGIPMGLSTLFGYAGSLGGREFAVGYRVTWHFVMNFLPMPFAMYALMQWYRTRGAEPGPSSATVTGAEFQVQISPFQPSPSGYLCDHGGTLSDLPGLTG
jgi:hypothetical protein